MTTAISQMWRWLADLLKWWITIMPWEQGLRVRLGAILGVVSIDDCRRVEAFARADLDAFAGGLTQREMGDFSPRRFGWLLSNPRRFERPLPCRGRQGLFDVPDVVVAEAMRTAVPV